MIIVNYNVKYFLEQCLFSVQKACRNIDAEVFVVDNHSTDGSLSYLKPRFPAVNFIFNSRNEGFAKANNQAVSIARGEYILFLNPDTIIAEDCFEKGIHFLVDHPEAGALGVHMVDGAGNFLKESKRAFPSPGTSLYKLTGMAKLFPRSRHFAKYYLGHLPEKENHEVDVLAGAFMLIPRAVINKTGSFDEMFFMYGEDVDLSYRIQKAGYKNYYFAGTSIIHFKGESTQRASINNVRLFYSAMSRFVKKHYSGTRAGIFIFFIRTGIWCRAAVSVVGNVFTRSRKPIHEKRKGVQTLIVSNEKDFSFVKEFLQKKDMPDARIVLGRVGYDSAAMGEVLGNISELPGLVKKYRARKIIFCEGGPGFKEIILAIQNLRAGTLNLFHAAGSSSIVGSDSAEGTGNLAEPDRDKITGKIID